MSAALAAPVIDGYRRDGHCVVRALASRHEVAAIRPAIEEAAARRTVGVAPLDERDTYGKAFLQATNVWRLDDAVREFVFDPRFARTAAQLMGVDSVRLYHDQALIKEPGGGPTPWHQDQRYWPLDTTDTITMWMPLADVAGEVGSMTFASGSHLLGDLGVPGISDETEALFADVVRRRGLSEDTHGALRAGDATFHAGWTLHRAGANPTGAPRPVITVIYFADGARVSEPADDYQRFDLAMWLKGAAPGERADGERNPRLC
ncbi:MAG TPA: phytanoyl-CoA dioxygenase family protein [Acidimicrobiales bacterium]|nr:phytanoyl-CoA dioxygenase family protein [Acidimicrobiales bacterium]